MSGGDGQGHGLVQLLIYQQVLLIAVYAEPCQTRVRNTLHLARHGGISPRICKVRHEV